MTNSSDYQKLIIKYEELKEKHKLLEMKSKYIEKDLELARKEIDKLTRKNQDLSMLLSVKIDDKIKEK